jgi:transaldolase
MSSLEDERSTKRARVEGNGNDGLTALDQLKAYTVIVADTGEISSIKQFGPQDATTNPSLILKAAQIPEYAHLVDSAVEFAKNEVAAERVSPEDLLDLALDKVAVNFGVEISKIIPGYVSIEVDARLSFNTTATVERAKRIIQLAKDMGVEKERILIKIAATYEGIRAGQILEQEEGIHCNLTLVFSLIQAAACAEAGITLISPFVGRILDWFKAKTGQTYTAETDPGVLSVKKIYQYFKTYQFSTIVMGKYY